MSETGPLGWAYAPLTKITSKIGSGATPRGGSDAYAKAGVPLIRSQNVHFDGFNDEGLVYLDAEQAEALKSVAVRAGDVLLNITGASIGRVCLAPPRMVGARVNQHVAIVRPAHERIDPAFLTAYLRSPAVQQRIHSEEYGVTRQALTKAWISDLQTPIPPLAEQRRIVEKIEAFLERVQNVRERVQAARRVIALLRQSILCVLCLPDANEGGSWHRMALGDLLSDIRYGTAVKCEYERRGTPVLRIPNVQSGVVDQSDLKFAALAHSEVERLALRRGDILMVRSNGSLGLVGRTAVVTDRENGFTFAGYLVRLRLRNDLADPQFVQAALATRESRELIETIARSTSGVNNINSEEIKSLPISLPPLPEQRRVVEQFSALEQAAAAVEQRIKAAMNRTVMVPQSVLAKAFIGQLVPTEAELARREGRSYEPTSVLLERGRY